MPVTWEGQVASQITMWDLRGDTSKLREVATGIRTDVSDAVLVTDENLLIQSVNPAAEQLYGWSEQELIGRHGAEALPAELVGERSEEHTSELQSLMRNSYAVFCLKKKKQVK